MAKYLMVLFLPILIIFTYLSVAYSMDWMSLHVKADNLSLPAAQEIVAKNPGSVGDQYVLGLVNLNLHQDQAAYQVFSELLASNPDLVEATWGLAESLRRKHEVVKAENLLNEAFKVDPNFIPALISLAYIKYSRMDFEGSARLALKVIQQGRDKMDLSNYVRAYCLYAGAKGMIAYYGGIFSKVINGLAVKSNLDKAQRLQPNAPGVLFGLGSYYLLAPAIAGGNKIKAAEYFNKALKADSLFADVYVRLAQLSRFKKNKQEYDFYMNKALEIDPQNELALDIKSGRCKFICNVKEM